jgi:hypothetical protein
LILDSSPYRYQQFISDIAGQDIQVHQNNIRNAIAVVRNWLGNHSETRVLPGGAEIYRRFQLFEQELPTLCRELKVQREELTFNDTATIIDRWLHDNP